MMLVMGATSQDRMHGERYQCQKFNRNSKHKTSPKYSKSAVLTIQEKRYADNIDRITPGEKAINPRENSNYSRYSMSIELFPN